MPVTSFDWNSQYRMPQGWVTFADGSVGPPNPGRGSDWNAPYRGGAPDSSGAPDWLKQLIPSPGASAPYGLGAAPAFGTGPEGEMPSGGLLGRQAVTPGAASMGFPAEGGPEIYPPQGSNVGTGKEVGPWTNPFADADPRSWFKADPNATFEAGKPMGANVTGGGGFNPLSLLGGGNPFARAAIAAGGVMQPTPADTGELPLSLSGARPEHPHSMGAMPAPGGRPSRPYSPTPENYPSWPTVGAQGSSPAATMANAPPGSPSATPRPARPYTPTPPARPRASALSASPFTLVDRVNAGPLAAQPDRRYQTALDLSRLFGRG
jgi:hypothetical protein